MQHVYPYKTTTDKLSQAYAHVEGSGHTVEHLQFMGGRDWVLICRGDEREVRRG